jgi:hypothetical protein
VVVYAAAIRCGFASHRILIPATPGSARAEVARGRFMQWRLNAMTILAKGIIMALLVLAGASIVRNVTAALTAVVGGCETVVARLG